jgi:signal transduction histidine kinase
VPDQDVAIIKEKLEKLIHNLKNEIAVLRRCCEALEEEIAKGPNKANFAVIMKYTGLMKSVTVKQQEYAERITDLKDADPDTGLQNIQLEDMITKILEGIVPKEIKWRIIHNADYADAIVHGSRFDLDSMFMNLVKNSVEAIQRLEGPEKESEQEIVVAIEHIKSMEDIRLVIQDTGTGFPSDEIANGIFNKTNDEKFSSKKGSGHGVGLKSAREVCEMHKGTIRARNRPNNRGAMIIIRLQGAPYWS